MAGDGRSWRPTRPRLAGTTLVVVVVGIVVVSFALANVPPAVPAPPAVPTSSIAAIASSPTTPGPTAPSATASDEAWSAVDLRPLAPVARLEASARDEAGVAPDAHFALTSLSAEPALALAERLSVSPEVRLAVAAGSGGRTATLTPATRLTPGTRYRITLRTADGGLAASWAFRVRSPVRVLSTIPGDRMTEVPSRTGIEVTFDQDGVADMADHFTIRPAASGRFERHGRTQVFVPDHLTDATLYTVTIAAGLRRTGTDLALGSDTVFRFETAGPRDTKPHLEFARDTVETSPTEAPVIGVVGLDPGGDATAAVPTTARIEVHRIATLDSAAAILADFLAAPRWTSFSTPVMPTGGLPVAATFTAHVERLTDPNAGAIRFPEPLPAGRYVVEILGERPSQAFLQVTPVSAWVSVLTDRTVVWVNDVAARRPLAGATARVLDGRSIGRSGADGLVVGPTPDALVTPAEAHGRDVPDSPPLLEVRAPTGAVLLVPFEVGWDGGIYRGEWWERTGSADATYWSILLTERELYRTTDVVNVWGYLRGRDDGSVPPTVALRLVGSEAASSADSPVDAHADVAPDRAGAFSASLPIASEPVGSYVVQAVVDGRVVASTWVEVGVVRKPAYGLDLVPDRRAAISGTEVRWTTSATFFDGTAVPDLRLAYSLPDGSERSGTTDATGLDVQSVELRPDDCPTCEDVDAQPMTVGVRPAVQEEADIAASSSVEVFPSSHDIDLAARLDGRTLRIDGSVDEVDLAKAEAALEAGGSYWGWSDGDDPDGAPVAGAVVRVTVTELVPVRRQVGTDYDFIEKVVRPRYEYETKRSTVRTLGLRTDGHGLLAASVTVPDATHQYQISAETADAQGRTTRHSLYAGTPFEPWWSAYGVRFEPIAGKDDGAQDEQTGSTAYGTGDLVAWRMVDGVRPVVPAASDRFLYIVAQRGLRSATVSSMPSFRRVFSAADAPRVFVIGVRFTGSTYAPKAAAWADFDTNERELTVSVTADRARYGPGDDARLTVTARDAAGRPVVASVILQAVDEKLFAMGRASVPDPLDRLYAPVDSGIVRLTSTHQVPVNAGSEGEGGDTTAYQRSDFRDTVAFKALVTDRAGRATTTVHLSDDLTSWHVSASAMTADLQAGVDDLLVPVGLPLFVDATVADEYLASDRPVVRLRAYGDALRAGDAVVFDVASSTLGLPTTRLRGNAFGEVDLALPELTVGRHALTISVTAPTRLDASGRPLADRLVRTFDVVRSRLSAARTAFVTVGDPLPAVEGDEAATYTFTDAGRARYVPYLDAAATPTGMRLDRAIAASEARDLLIRAFDRDPADLPPDTFDPEHYRFGVSEDEAGVRSAGASLLPHSGLDPWLAARIAVLAPTALETSALREALITVRDDDATRRDLWIAAAAGLSSLGEPDTGGLDAVAKASDLTVTEQLYLGLGYAAAGDDASAIAVERELLAHHGEQLGPWVRLQAGPAPATLETTALLAVLAARVGDPLAPSMMEYVRTQPSREASLALELVAASAAALERAPAHAATFAYTLAGRRTEVRLSPGESMTIVLNATQRADLRLEPLSGTTGVAIGWRAPADLAALPHDPALTLTRRLPTGPLPVDHVATIDLQVAFDPATPEAPCYEVVEEVPSGLAPLPSWDLGGGNGIITPASVVGQRVTFCVPNPIFTDASGSVRTGTLRYAARVVNEGTFTWEPAVLQLEGAADVGTTVDGGKVTIGGP